MKRRVCRSIRCSLFIVSVKVSPVPPPHPPSDFLLCVCVCVCVLGVGVGECKGWGDGLKKNTHVFCITSYLHRRTHSTRNLICIIILVTILTRVLTVVRSSGRFPLFILVWHFPPAYHTLPTVLFSPKHNPRFPQK